MKDLVSKEVDSSVKMTDKGVFWSPHAHAHMQRRERCLFLFFKKIIPFINVRVCAFMCVI